MEDTLPVSELSLLTGLAFTVIAAFAAIILIIRIRAVRSFLLSMIGLIPALPLMGMALIAALFWRVFLRLAALLPFSQSFTQTFLKVINGREAESATPAKPSADRFAVLDEDEAVTAQAPDYQKRLEMARSVWPEERFPYLYRNVPEDLQRPLFEDGRLPGGVPLTWLADRHVTPELIERACKAAIAAVLMITLLPLALYLWMVASAFALTLLYHERDIITIR